MKVGLNMPKKKKYQKKDFESTGVGYDVSANIYLSMMKSKAWEALTKNQRILYLYLKLQYYSQKRKPNKDDKSMFYFNQTKWMNEYQLYSEGNKKSFYNDIEQLIIKGFIDCVSSGKTTRERNIYQYSSRWQKYNEKNEYVEPKYMTHSMLVKFNKENKKNSDKTEN